MLLSFAHWWKNLPKQSVLFFPFYFLTWDGYNLLSKLPGILGVLKVYAVYHHSNSKGIFGIPNAQKVINTEKNKLIESYVILYSEKNLIKSPSFVAIANLG